MNRKNDLSIFYIGTACNVEYENKVTAITKATFSIAQNNLERALLDGFIKNGLANIDLHCIPVLRYDVLSKSMFYKGHLQEVIHGLKTRTFTIIKVRFLKELFVIFSTLVRVLVWYLRNSNKEKVAYITINYLPVTLPILVLSKIFRFEVIAMICDLSRNTYSIERGKDYKSLSSYFLKLYIMVTQIVERNFSKYVFLTTPMNDLINIKSKPFEIVEGIYNNDLCIKETVTFSNKKVIIYAGTLFEDYGISMIIEAFMLIDDSDFELHFYGNGPMEEVIKRYSIDDSRIKFYGFVNRKQLFDKLQSASLLVNLRNPDKEYTKYSFPSKLFEYLVSGTPVLTTKLDGIPSEYYDYMYITDSYNPNLISKCMKHICMIDENQRSTLALRAQRFILEKKNSLVQVDKIINLIYR